VAGVDGNLAFGQGITAAGTVRDFHPVPYYALKMNYFSRTITITNIENYCVEENDL